jgi:hypothetical protein
MRRFVKNARRCADAASLIEFVITPTKRESIMNVAIVVKTMKKIGARILMDVAVAMSPTAKTDPHPEQSTRASSGSRVRMLCYI